MKAILYAALIIFLGAAAGIGAKVANASPLEHPGQSERAAAGNAGHETSLCGSAYIVKSGDTLSRIAGRCGVTLNDLLAANGLAMSSIIRPGQHIVIPGVAAGRTAGSPAFIGCTNPYTIRSGDTLGMIAQRCGTSVAELKRLNGLYSDLIQAGQSLVTRGSAAAPSRASSVAPASPPAVPASIAAPSSVPVNRIIVQRDVNPIFPTPTPCMEPPIQP